jgi:catechol-2,3-dioxygenase
MSWGLITEMGTVTLQTSRFEESVAHARNILGLRETHRTNDTAYLSADDRHHEIVYLKSSRDAMDHLTFVARDGDAVAEVRCRVRNAGFTLLSDKPLQEGVEEAVSFVGPEGYIFEIATPVASQHGNTPGYGPQRYGHVNLQPSQFEKMRDFFIDLLDFRVSDRIGDSAAFLRCNSDHHGIALIRGRGTLHHHAWQTQSIADLGRLADRLDAAGERLLWGPVRHGAGRNIAAYYQEPGGAIVEVYTDLEQIYNPSRPPIEWDPEDHGWFTRWVDWRPDDFRSYGIPPAERPTNA